jgi:ketosteroid isomerase-like protein
VIQDTERDAAVVRQAIEAMGALQVDLVRELVHDDLVLELPFRPAPLPTRLDGDDAHAFMRLLTRVLTRLEFHSIAVHGSTTPGLVFAEYRSNGLTTTGAPYCNTYAAVFEVRDGRISRWREFFDPSVLQAAFP